MQAKVYGFLQTNPSNIITKTYKEALLASEVAKYLQIPHVVLPDFRANPYDDLRSYKDELFHLNTSLNTYYSNRCLVISPINTIIRQLPTKQYFQHITISFADTIDLNWLKTTLVLWGYDVVNIVQQKGEVSFRGDIIDIYPINHPHPIRISLFDTEVENIREFDEYTQKSINEIDTCTIIPALAALTSQEYDDINHQILQRDFDVFYKDLTSLGYWFLKRKFLFDKVNLIYDMTSEIEEYQYFHTKIPIEFDIINESECVDLHINNIKEFILANSNQPIELLAKNEVLLQEKGIDYPFTKSDVILNIKCKDKIIISLNRYSPPRRKNKAIILDDIKKGDFVVHQTHGIGRFDGLQQIEVLGKKGEFAQITYANDDKLLLPIENLDLIDRYIAPGGSLPTLDKMGKASFSKTKQKIQEKIFAIAADIIKTAAQRESLKPFSLSFDGVEEFINKAGFEYTKDQKSAIQAIINDLQTKIMDRLLSGDVGFGKTEIAMVAAFIMAQNRYQTAVIAPTTILVSQHYDTFIKRFQDYDIKIAKLDRFTSTKDKKLIQAQLENGEIDIIIATHSAFNLTYKNLGLVVIDEEHKFGVTQKEKLKTITQNTHLLSMSATPIPRSLNLALSKIKDLSALNVAPKDKQETRTFIKEYSPELIKEVVLREIKRGGQVFYIFNNINYIEHKKEELSKLMPNLRILTLHAKLTPAKIEKAMYDFIHQKYDLLLSTTIVESGIHIPNVNTVIVENADRFGIADLHQIRGRVARGDKEGYAYFIVKDKQEISKEATKRLLALEENSFLGSGAVLAMHDLEIRGGGNIIGTAQSGQIKNVGYSLYVKMLEDALRTLNNEHTPNKTEVKLNINAYLCPSVIADDRARIEIYKRLSKATSLEEVYEIQKEVIDRYGAINTPTNNFFTKIKIRILATKQNIQSISNYAENITILYHNGDKQLLKAAAKDDEIILETIQNTIKDKK
ncbi:MAG: DEAD/DEAH box helicase [Epsilonproteobacteria bacterium]|nr:DEAD/DEAH box helicase [Campylobacterota bacterium]